MDIIPSDYLSITSKLPVGAVRKVPHEGCSNSACLRIENSVDGLKFYCFKCREYLFESYLNSPQERARRLASQEAYREARASVSYDLPSDFSHSIAPGGLAWLGSGGWTVSIIRHYNIGYSEKLNRVILPVYFKGNYSGYIARAVEAWQRPKYLEKVKPGCIWGSSGTNMRQQGVAVICEDILSAGRCGEFIQGYALLGTSLGTELLNHFKRYKKILLWLDPDKGGKSGIKTMIHRLRLFSEVCVIQSSVDPKLLTNTEIKEKLCWCLR